MESTGGTSKVVRSVGGADFPPSVAIVDAVAELEGTTPLALSAPGGITLFEYIDPDALDTVMKNGERSVEVSFQIENYEVTVTSSKIEVAHQEDATTRLS